MLIEMNIHIQGGGGVANLKPSRPGPIIFFSAYFTSQI